MTVPFLPYVSVCTPTFNRRPFIESMIRCFDHQIYPKDRMEWIIIDDGTDKIDDLVKTHPNVKYYAYDEKMSLGKKRNLMHAKSCGDIIVYMDDDDYYPPERVSHAVEVLMANPSVMCAGSSEIYIYFKHLAKMFQFGPYAPNHATAGTFAFKRELLMHTKYDETACLAEERKFLKDYSIPMVQLNPMKVILVFSHEHNTFDKRKLIEHPNPEVVKETTKTLDDFMVGESAPELKRFFVDELDNLLKYYEPGLPKMKPDVIKQTAELEKNMIAIMKQQQQQQQQQQQPDNTGGGTIIMHQEGKEPVALTNDQVVNIIQVQQAQVKELTAKVAELQADRDKLERSLSHITGGPNRTKGQLDGSILSSTTSDGQAQLQQMLSTCLSDLRERDETLQKLKGLYMKSIVEVGELKTQISDMRHLVQNAQSQHYASTFVKSVNEPANTVVSDDIELDSVSSETVSEPAIRLIIDEPEIRVLDNDTNEDTNEDTNDGGNEVEEVEDTTTLL